MAFTHQIKKKSHFIQFEISAKNNWAIMQLSSVAVIGVLTAELNVKNENNIFA